MAIFAHIRTATPQRQPFMLEWAQPYKDAELLEDWTVASDFGVSKVQRNTLAPNVMWCAAMVGGEPKADNTFVVSTGAFGSPAVGWSTPDLTGFRIITQGQDGFAYVGELAVAEYEEIRRDGFHHREVCRWLHQYRELGGTQAVFGVHLYMQYRSDTTAVRCKIRVSNASCVLASNGYGVTDFYGRAFIRNTTIRPPNGWSLLYEGAWKDGPEGPNGSNPAAGPGPFTPATGTTNLHTGRTAWEREFVIYPGIGTPELLHDANDLLYLRGTGLATPAGRSYHNVQTYGPQKTLLIDLDTPHPIHGFAAWGSGVGYEGQEVQSRNYYSILLGAAVTGVAGYAPDLELGRLGVIHPTGPYNATAPAGITIGPLIGQQQVRHHWLWARLYHKLKMTGCGVFCYHKATGKPITTRDFADAHVSGQQPFSYNAYGYPYGPYETLIPVDYRCTIPGLTNVEFGPTEQIGGTEVGNNSLNGGLFSSPNGGEYELYFHRKPDDPSHFWRMTYAARALVYFTGDLMAIDDVKMIAEEGSYSWSEKGHWNYNDPQYANSLLFEKNYAQINEGQAFVFMGRDAGSSSETQALAYAVSSSAERAAMLPRMQLIRDLWRYNVATETGVPMRYDEATMHGGELAHPYLLYGCPLTWDCATAGIECPIAYHGAWCVMEQIGHDPVLDNRLLAFAAITIGIPQLWGETQPGSGVRGYAKYYAVGYTGGPMFTLADFPMIPQGQPNSAFFGDNGQSCINAWPLIEYAYRLTTGAEANFWISIAKQLQVPNVNATPLERGCDLISEGTGNINMPWDSGGWKQCIAGWLFALAEGLTPANTTTGSGSGSTGESSATFNIAFNFSAFGDWSSGAAATFDTFFEFTANPSVGSEPPNPSFGELEAAFVDGPTDVELEADFIVIDGRDDSLEAAFLPRADLDEELEAAFVPA